MRKIKNIPRITLLLALMVGVVLMVSACADQGGKNDGTENETRSSVGTEADKFSSENDKLDAENDKLSSETESTIAGTQDTTLPINDDAPEKYLCRLNGLEHKQLAFYYEKGRLVKVEYSLYIKGVPEEIEERKRLENYSGVDMIDKGSYFSIEMDAAAGEMKYLQDTVPFFSGVEDWSWKNVKGILEKNGYQILK